MSFSTEVKRSALVASARRCCLCRRYKGVKVEVHHIIPVAEGGTDTIENAIPLCFDCHADAGHYNPKHPRGTKFSRQELVRQRDAWYQFVKDKGLPFFEADDVLYIRHVVCRDFSALAEISQINLANFPARKPILYPNEVFAFIQQLIQRQEKTFRHDYVLGKGYMNKEELQKSHPDAVEIPPGDRRWAYYQTRRIPNREEVVQLVRDYDRLTLDLLEENPVDELCLMVTYDDPCAGSPYQQVLRLRPLWAVFLAAENISNVPLKLSAVDGFWQDEKDLSLRPFVFGKAKDRIFRPPPVSILPGSTLIIPEAISLAPFYAVDMATGVEDIKKISPGVSHIVRHAILDKNDLSDFRIIGPRFVPEILELEDSRGSMFRQAVHSLDMTNVYFLNREWSIGSCPHVFVFLAGVSTWTYLGQALSRVSPGRIGSARFALPKGSTLLRVTELEEEISTILGVSIPGRALLEKPVQLRRWESLTLDITDAEEIVLWGCYEPADPGGNLIKDPPHQNQLICDELCRYNQGKARKEGQAEVLRERKGEKSNLQP